MRSIRPPTRAEFTKSLSTRWPNLVMTNLDDGSVSLQVIGPAIDLLAVAAFTHRAVGLSVWVDALAVRIFGFYRDTEARG